MKQEQTYTLIEKSRINGQERIVGRYTSLSKAIKTLKAKYEFGVFTRISFYHDLFIKKDDSDQYITINDVNTEEVIKTLLAENEASIQE